MGKLSWPARRGENRKPLWHGRARSRSQTPSLGEVVGRVSRPPARDPRPSHPIRRAASLFRHRPGIRCSAGRIAPGVDVRGDGGYLIWWPAAGLAVLRDAPLAPWPEWLRVKLSSLQRPRIPHITVPDDHALARLVRLVAGAREGERNDLTYWAACRAGEMVASGLLGAETAAAVIAEAATRAGLPRAEAERTACSGIRTIGGLAHP
jgi:hypothetical protein